MKPNKHLENSSNELGQRKEPHTLTLGLVLSATQYKNPKGGIIGKKFENR